MSISIGTAETLAQYVGEGRHIRQIELVRIDWVLPVFALPHATRTFIQAVQRTGVSALNYPLVMLRSVSPTFVRGIVCGAVWMVLCLMNVGGSEIEGIIFMQALVIGGIWLIARQFRLLAARVAGTNNGELQRRSVRGAKLYAIDELRDRFR